MTRFFPSWPAFSFSMGPVNPSEENPCKITVALKSVEGIWKQDHGSFPSVIIFQILIHFSLDDVSILLRENWCQFLLGLKGLMNVPLLLVNQLSNIWLAVYKAIFIFCLFHLPNVVKSKIVCDQFHVCSVKCLWHSHSKNPVRLYPKLQSQPIGLPKIFIDYLFFQADQSDCTKSVSIFNRFASSEESRNQDVPCQICCPWVFPLVV